MTLFINALGWYGVIAIVGAYALANFDVIGVHDLSYQLLNLTGSIGILIEAFSKKDYQPAVLNLIWAAIGIVALFR
jgi:hypothetical protein